MKKNEKEVAKNKKRIEFLKKCQYYLESKPKEEFILKMQLELKFKINKIDDDLQSVGMELNPKSEAFRNLKKDLYSAQDYDKLKKQINMVSYLLSDIII